MAMAMHARMLSFAMILASVAGVAAASELSVEITAPLDKSSVPQRPMIEGRVSDVNVKVWVVVHPLEVTDYWVQPRPTVRSDGWWKAQIHVGRPGDVDAGKLFEIRAVANPERELEEGNVLSDWPKGGAISAVIEVTRR
jgi:hypothetical protein